jgi:putative ABC transport system ATP-binding protein
VSAEATLASGSSTRGGGTVAERDATVIECVGLLRVYESPTGRVQAVRGVDLRIEGGRSVAVVGPSGSGKSSLLRMIGGLDEPSAGHVRIAGVDLVELSPRARRRMRAALLSHVYQRPSDNLLGHLDVHQQVQRVATRRGAARSDVDELLERLGLADRRRHLPNELSGGEQQRLAFARGAIGRPAVIIADEPTAELDSASADRVLDVIGDLARDGITVLVATHDERVMARCDRLVLLRDGAVASVTDAAGELAVIDGAGRLQLPAELREHFPDDRARLRWDPLVGHLIVERPG